jgi:hypothetical protein
MITEFDVLLEQAFAALDRVAREDSSGHITVADPLGGVGRGWDEIVRAASVYTGNGVDSWSENTCNSSVGSASTVT